MNTWVILIWGLAAMPLDLNVPPIVIEAPKRRKLGRVIEAVLILGIVFLAISTLAPFFLP